MASQTPVLREMDPTGQVGGLFHARTEACRNAQVVVARTGSAGARGDVSPAAATSDLCGTTIATDFEPDHDLVCPGSGLTVVADGIRLDLNGHTIAGSRSGIGISVVGRTDVSIVGGVILGPISECKWRRRRGLPSSTTRSATTTPSSGNRSDRRHCGIIM
jgi:hypothetical protein